MKKPAAKKATKKTAKAKAPKEAKTWADGHKPKRPKPLKTRLTSTYGPIRPELVELPPGSSVSNDALSAISDGYRSDDPTKPL